MKRVTIRLLDGTTIVRIVDDDQRALMIQSIYTNLGRGAIGLTGPEEYVPVGSVGSMRFEEPNAPTVNYVSPERFDEMTAHLQEPAPVRRGPGRPPGSKNR